MNPASLESLIQRAISYQKRGNYTRACMVYNALIRRGVSTARVLTNLGAALYEAGRSDAGLGLFEAALELDPTYQDAWNNLRIHAVSTDDWPRLSVNAKRFMEADADNWHACHAEAQVLMAAGSFSESRKILNQLLSTYPDDLELRVSMARCNLATADFDSALGNLLYILSLDPGHPFASIELAEMAAKTGDLDSSMAILQSAHASYPRDIRIMQKIAREHQLRGRMSEALSMYKLALGVEPDSPIVLAQMAYCYSEIGDIDMFFEIIDALDRRNEVSPEMLLSVIFVCSIHGEDYLGKLREYSERYWDTFSRRIQSRFLHEQKSSELLLAPAPPTGPRPLRNRKRVGIVTAGLGTHVESCFLGSFLMNYAKDILEVDVISNRWLSDGVSETLSLAVDRCHSISDLSLNAAREFVRRQEYDLIIETSGFTSGSAIHVLADRCAPVQCHWIGYHASTYMPTMDYFIGDHVLTPEKHADRFSEHVHRLNRAWLAATPFTQIPEASPSSEEAVVLGSFSQIAKLTKRTLELWAQLLVAAPQCRIVFKDKFVNDPETVKRIYAFFASRGIGSHRLIFKHRSSNWFEHMCMYNLVDIALDTTPWSSATTAFDALSMGIPLISIKGKTTSGLMSSSVLHHCGKGEWVAEDEAQYVAKNLALIENVTVQRVNRREFQSEILTSQLFDGPSMARAIEGFVLGL